jgi:hypothetical protein
MRPRLQVEPADAQREPPWLIPFRDVIEDPIFIPF